MIKFLSSDTDFNFTRKLIQENLVPNDVFIQVLILVKKEWIKKSVEAMDGVKKGILHLYNSTNEFQRRAVFQKSNEKII
jgi:2-isopropylmalate synthase